MKYITHFFLAALCLIGFSDAATIAAQNPPKGTVVEFGMPISDFPIPPGNESATALVNFKLDAMDLNTGNNLIHHDEASDVKLFAYLNPHIEQYTLTAERRDDGRKVNVYVELADAEPTCIFASIGADWINVICSEKYTYGPPEEVMVEDILNLKEKKEEEKVEEKKEIAVPNAVKNFEKSQSDSKKKKKKKKKKKNKKNKRPLPWPFPRP